MLFIARKFMTGKQFRLGVTGLNFAGVKLNSCAIAMHPARDGVWCETLKPGLSCLLSSGSIQPALSDFKRCIRDIERKVKASRTAVLIVGPHELDERREELEEWEKILTE